MNRVYRMNQEEYQWLLKVASDQVPFGIYAVEKGDYAELRCDHCKSMTQIKSLIRGFKAQGYKVYDNRKTTRKEVAQEAAEGALMSAT